MSKMYFVDNKGMHSLEYNEEEFIDFCQRLSSEEDGVELDVKNLSLISREFRELRRDLDTAERVFTESKCWDVDKTYELGYNFMTTECMGAYTSNSVLYHKVFSPLLEYVSGGSRNERGLHLHKREGSLAEVSITGENLIYSRKFSLQSTCGEKFTLESMHIQGQNVYSKSAGTDGIYRLCVGYDLQNRIDNVDVTTDNNFDIHREQALLGYGGFHTNNYNGDIDPSVMYTDDQFKLILNKLYDTLGDEIDFDKRGVESSLRHNFDISYMAVDLLASAMNIDINLILP